MAAAPATSNEESASTASSAHAAALPYGVLAQDLGENPNGLEYGAMANEFPANYDPYLYGHPDTPASENAQQHTPQEMQPVQHTPQPPQQGPNHPYYNPEFYPFGLPDDAAQNGQSNYGAPHPDDGMHMPPQQHHEFPQGPMNAQQKPHRIINGIDLDDPQQNPAYGHWDPASIISFILALVFPCPILPAILGGMSMWRTKVFHMKGFGLAVAAVIINVLYSISFFYLMAHGISMNDLANQMQSVLQTATDSTKAIKA
ncbi:hypothetical protein [Bifidobacterium dolichotidis]